MPISKEKRIARERSREFIKAEREAMRERYGYAALKAKHGKSKRPDFPDLKTASKYALSDTAGNGTKRPSAAEHPDAKAFPVQSPHKQGYMLFTGADDARYAGGKKS